MNNYCDWSLQWEPFLSLIGGTGLVVQGFVIELEGSWFKLSSHSILWCHSVVVIILHNFIQPSLNSGSALVQILLTACQRLAMVRISDNGPSRKRFLQAKCSLLVSHTTKIPKKQFIIIIVIIIILS